MSVLLCSIYLCLLFRDHKKMPPDGYIKVSPDKMTKAGRELYLGKNFDKYSIATGSPALLYSNW